MATAETFESGNGPMHVVPMGPMALQFDGSQRSADVASRTAAR
jgi:hypothetical protein